MRATVRVGAAGRSPLDRSVAAEIRTRLATSRKSGKELAHLIGVSQNYLAKRLRGEAPLTLDDLSRIGEVLDADPRAAGILREAALRSRATSEDPHT